MNMRIAAADEATGRIVTKIVDDIVCEPPVNAAEAAWRLRGIDEEVVRAALRAKLGDAADDAMRGAWDPGDAQLPADWSPPAGGVRARIGPCGSDRRIEIWLTTADDEVGIEVSLHVGHAVTGARRPVHPADIYRRASRDGRRDEFVDAPLGDAADILKAAWDVSVAEGVSLGRGEQTAAAWASTLDGPRTPPPAPSTGDPTRLIVGAGIMSPWRLSEADLLWEGVEPWASEPDPSGWWAQSWLDAAGSTRLVALFAALAAFEARRASWMGETTAGDWAALEVALKRRDVDVLTTLLDGTLEGVAGGSVCSGHDPRDRWLRGRLKRVGFASVTAPTGRDLAALDYAEVAFRALEAASEGLALSERCPSFEELARASNAIGFEASQAAVSGIPLRLDICERHLQRNTRLDDTGRRGVGEFIVEELDEFRRFFCAGCPTPCLGRRQSATTPGFFSAGHPIEPKLASTLAFAASDSHC